MRVNIFKQGGNASGGFTSSGGTLTGPLILAGNPTQPLEATTKQYVDGLVATKANSTHTHILSQITDWPSEISITELTYLDGVTSNIQTQLNNKIDLTGFNTITSNLIPNSQKGSANGIAPLDSNGKIPNSYLNSVPLDGNAVVSLLVPSGIYASLTYNITITDYDSLSTYTVSVSSGSVSRTDDIITFNAPSTPGNVTLTVTRNGVSRDITLNVQASVVNTPSITSPTNNATNIAILPNITSSAFSFSGTTQTHVSSQWQIATDASFTNIVRDSGETTTNLTSWQPSSALNLNTVYYVRVRHKGNITGWSNWSSAIQFTTVNAYGWVAKLGGAYNDYFTSITSTIENNTIYLYAVGYEDSSTADSVEALITKWGANGNLIWQRKIGGSNHDRFYSIISTVESNTVYLYAVGLEQSSAGKDKAFITKWDTSGNLIWQRKIGGSNYDAFYSIISTIESNTVYLYAVGYESSSTGTGKAFITKWDTSGNLIWQRKIGGTGSDTFTSIISTIESNTVYLYAVGSESSSTGNYEAFITKWDTSGNLIWQRKIGGSNYDAFYSIISTIESNTVYLYAVGEERSSAGNTEAFITKWDTNGNLIWQRKIGGSNADIFYSIISTIEGNTIYLYAVGYESSSAGNTEAFITKWDTNGNLIWQRKIGGSSSDVFNSITSTIESSTVYLYAVGYERSTTGNNDEALITKWNTSGTITTGSLAGIPQLSLNNSSLSTSTTSLSVATTFLSVSNPGLTVSTTSLSVSTTSLTRVFSAY